ncbi:SusC/RagA family TonB-linked outer membrane protein [Solitalea sp. MAHUQ-68]|uniref:SusC/RagA family TonB-linked outer membrane protein n=1 Tax=Solitalea agri TaxID=2953739 RepID=A0A9X2F238_9SPHI|nr:SusC/RagA family TonB-linked outer membrane protein [Solitalea agri]MCO4292699.1 SusC/RagA family TonB-linked outer membrane protein [Solitalea agri]
MKQNLQKSVKHRIAQLGMLAMLSALSLNAWAATFLRDIRQVKVTISFQGETLEQAFMRLSEVSNVSFNYNHNELRKITTKQLTFKNESLPQVLSAVLKETNFKYKEEENGVIIYQVNSVQEKNLASSVNQAADKITVKGTVSDKFGPLAGVSISVKQSSNGTSTDADGAYSIVVNKGETLIFSMIGYRTQEVTIGSQTAVNITLESEVTQLEEVVAVGYGTQKKVNLTGAIATVSAKDFENRPITNVSTAIQGKMSGVTVLQRSGQPGRDNGTIRIRGIGTLNDSSPLVLIDGLQGDMNTLDPNDIESVSVLKDAASAAIYGSRAANGVILITTKKGKKNSPAQLTYSAYSGWQNPTRLPQFLNSADYASLYNEALQNEGKPKKYTDEEIAKFASGVDPDKYPNTDWLGLFFTEKGYQQNHYLGLSGGSDKTTYSISLGYFDQQGLIKNSFSKRYNLKTNVESQVYDRLKVGLDLNLNRKNITEPTNPYTGDMSQIFRQVIKLSPTIPYKYSNGQYGYGQDGNPIAWMDLDATNASNYNDAFGNVHAELTILKGLTASGMLGARTFADMGSRFIKDIQFYDPNTGNPTKYQGPNSQRDYNANSLNITSQALLNYNGSFGKHDIKGLAGFSRESYRNDWSQGERKNFPNNELTELNPGSTDGQEATGSAYEWALQSYFGRLGYTYNNRYMFEANARYDGSSRFANGNRYGLFPSFSAGWRVSEEEFLKSLNWLSNLKLRASWGKLGNQLVTDASGNQLYYPTVSTISLGKDVDYNFNDAVASGGIVTKGVNPELTWETSTNTDLGVDISFFNSKLSFTADYFSRATKDILLDFPAPVTYGLSAPARNAGSMTNKGFEFELSHNNQFGQVAFNASTNFTIVNNEVTDLKGKGDIFYSSNAQIARVGVPYKAFYGYEVEGIFKTQEEVAAHATQSGVTKAGDLIYKDQNNDHKIDAGDRVIIGNSIPKYIYGLNLGANYKGFDVSVFMQGAAGHKGLLNNEAIGGFGDRKPLEYQLGRWTPENPNAEFPRVLATQKQNEQVSSFWVRDASYLRLKNLQLGYSFPKSITEKMRINALKLYLSGQNLFTITKYPDGYDPELPEVSRGANYPQVKVYTLGLDVKF